MPPVDHLSSRGILNLLLDRAFPGIPAGLPPGRTVIGLFTNFCRLTDKALREYDASRAELLLYLSPQDGLLRISPYLRAIDHMENCISATHRAALNAGAAGQQDRAGQRLTPRQSNGWLTHGTPSSTPRRSCWGCRSLRRVRRSARPTPYSLRPANTCVVIGADVLTYKELVSAMAKCRKTIEVTAGWQPGRPGRPSRTPGCGPTLRIL